MVACNDDDIKLRRAGAGLLQEGIKLALRSCGWIGIVENITSDQQGINLLGHDGIQQPVQETLVLVVAIKIMQRLAKMPIGSVQQAHEM